MTANVAPVQNEQGIQPTMRRVTVPDFYFSQAPDVAPFEGQANSDFQDALVAFHSGIARADCDFYHTLEMPDGSVLPGAWDLRGHENDYLGQVPLRNRSVLEFGPATGAISAHIASRGGHLTVFDLPIGWAPEMIPMDGVEIDLHRRNAIASYNRLRNSWWYARKCLGFDATAIYGDIYRLPADIGRHDVSV